MGAKQTAEFLVAARQGADVIDALPDALRPADVEEAYRAQAALVEILAAGREGPLVGYKVGCTNRAAMELLGADGPFFGRLLAGSFLESGATMRAPSAGTVAIEPEYAYQVARAMPSAEGPYDAESVVDYLGALIPSIEIVGGCYADITTVGPPSIVANNALNLGFVAGTPLRGDWEKIELLNIEVRVLIDGEPLATGTAANVLGHPLNVVAWLANELNARGGQLEPGDYVSTGTCTAVEQLAPGSSARCEFGSLGAVSVTLQR